jgi:hypothetical protein
MTQRKYLIILVLMLIPAAGRSAQTPQADNLRDAEQLFAMARGLWAPVELQGAGLTSREIDPRQEQARLRQACLFLEAAVQLAPSYGPAWGDLMTLYATEAINDPNRFNESFFQYNQLAPEDHHQVEAWLNYNLDSLNDRDSREDFLQNNLLGLRVYPEIYSLASTQLGIYAWEQGLIDDPATQPDEPPQYGARTYFEWALTSYNDKALEQLSALPMAQVEDPTGQLTPEEIQVLQQQIQQRQEMYSPLRWRVRLRNNPYDLQAVFNLIESLEL